MTPRPSSTSTPTSSPPPVEALVPLPALFQSQGPLGVNWGIEAFGAQYVAATGEGPPFLVYRRFGFNRGLYIVNARTGQTLFELPTDAEKYYEDDSAASSLYVLTYDDGDPSILIQSWDLRSGERLWEETINQSVTPNEIVAFKEGVLLIGHQYGPGPHNAFIFLDPANGQHLWQQSPDMPCFVFVSVFQVQLIDSRLHIRCEEQTWLIDLSNGEVVATFETEPGSFQDFIVGNQTAYLVRNVWEDVEGGGQVNNHYLEARDILTYNILWALQVPADVYLATFKSDVIYRSGNQVVRLNSENGEIVWQTMVTGDVPSTLLLWNHWLLVGSQVGYLHLLHAETGELIWEQDIWATIEPRSVYVSPVALLDDAIIVSYGGSYLSLGNNENGVWEQPTPIPSPTPTITPTSTPIPVVTLSPGRELPPPPDTYEIWPAVITAFLNADPTNVTRLEELLTEWSVSESPFPSPPFDLQTADLNGDGRLELLLVVNGPYLDLLAGWVMVIQQDEAGHFVLTWAEPATNPEFLSITDLNGDSTLDFVYGEVSYGVSQAYVNIVPVRWDGQAFINLAYELIASTNVHLDEVRIEDITGDDKQEIIIRGGTFGSLAAGPNRTSTFTYGWSEDGYVLLAQEPDLPQEYYFFVVEANQRLVTGDLETAIAIFENSLSSEVAIYDFYADHQRAFAEFQLMLAYLLLDDEAGAAVWANNGHYPDQLYSQVKQTFWNIYQDSHNWTIAAEAARKQVRLAGFEKAQLIPWVGYANTPLFLEDILPCAACLQGSIGSQYGP